jgi:hypothetical protein
MLAGKCKGKNHLVDIGIDGKILKWLIKKWDVEEGMDWMGPAQVRDM